MGTVAGQSPPYRADPVAPACQAASRASPRLVTYLDLVFFELQRSGVDVWSRGVLDKLIPGSAAHRCPPCPVSVRRHHPGSLAPSQDSGCAGNLAGRPRFTTWLDCRRGRPASAVSMVHHAGDGFPSSETLAQPSFPRRREPRRGGFSATEIDGYPLCRAPERGLRKGLLPVSTGRAGTADVRLEPTRTSVLLFPRDNHIPRLDHPLPTIHYETPVSHSDPRCLTTDTTRETPGVPFSAEVSHSPDRDGTQWDGMGQISRPTTSYPLQGPCRTTPTLDAPRLRSPHNGSHVAPRVRSQSSPSLNHPNPGSDTPIAGAVPL